MDKKPLFVLYSVVAITIVLSFSSIDAQTTVNTPGGNITNATKSMGASMANQSSAVVGNLSESVVTRTANAASSETESIVNQTANAAGNKTQDLSANSTI
jgi:hypothetical protein